MNRGHFRGGHFRSTGNRRHRGGLHGNTNGPPLATSVVIQGITDLIALITHAAKSTK